MYMGRYFEGGDCDNLFPFGEWRLELCLGSLVMVVKKLLFCLFSFSFSIFSPSYVTIITAGPPHSSSLHHLNSKISTLALKRETVNWEARMRVSDRWRESLKRNQIALHFCSSKEDHYMLSSPWGVAHML